MDMTQKKLLLPSPFASISSPGFVHLNSIISVFCVLVAAELEEVKGKNLAIERLSFVCPEAYLRLTIQVKTL